MVVTVTGVGEAASLAFVLLHALFAHNSCLSLTSLLPAPAFVVVCHGVNDHIRVLQIITFVVHRAGFSRLSTPD